MKRVLAGVLSLLLVLPAYADSRTRFFERNYGQWTAVGEVDPQGKYNPYCQAQTWFPNKATMALTYDMKRHELYLGYTNPDWNITNPPGSVGKLIIRFEDNRRWIAQEVSFEVVTARTIRIPNLDIDNFVTNFTAANKIFLFMPGSIPDVAAGLQGTRVTMNNVLECMKYAVQTGIVPPKKKEGMSTGIPGIHM